MPSEQDLLRTLDDEPGTPSTVDVRQAIVTGRRRRTRRRAGYVGAAAFTVLAVAGASMAGRLVSDAAPQPAATPQPAASTATAKAKSAYTIPGIPGWTPPPATPPTECTLQPLPAGDGAKGGLVSGADPTGSYIVGRTYPRSGGYQAVLWYDGKVREVELPGDLEESLTDVNPDGLAVGWSYTGKTDADTGPVPYAYRAGRVIKLPGVARGHAEAVNEAGAIVGDDVQARAAVLWASVTAKPVRLPVPAGTSTSTASDIDVDGTTVGTLDDEQPYVWFPDGRHRRLALPEVGGKPVLAARAFTVRNGWATGVGDLQDGTAALRWNVRTGEVRAFGEFLIRASTANAHGWQTGTDREGRGLLEADGRKVTLPDLVFHHAGDLTNIGTTLSDDGRIIAGQADARNGEIQAVLWRCT